MKSRPFQYVLALDPGGTKCDALLVAADGTLVAQCRLRDWATGGRHPQIVSRAIAQVLDGHAPAPLQIVGLHRKKSLNYLPALWQKHARIRQCSEAMSVLAAAGQTAGLVVIAGTGATVSLYSRHVKEAWLDGLGPVLGDGGGGYYIGREALRAVGRAMQLRRPATRLRRRVLQACGCRTLHELIRFSLQPRDRSLIASLTKIVDEEARTGDRLARQLLREGATVLAGTVREFVQHLSLARKEFPIVGAGSVAVQSDIFWRELCRQVRSIAPRCRPIRVPLPPVAGLAAIGLRNAAATAKLFATLKKELKP